MGKLAADLGTGQRPDFDGPTGSTGTEVISKAPDPFMNAIHGSSDALTDIKTFGPITFNIVATSGSSEGQTLGTISNFTLTLIRSQSTSAPYFRLYWNAEWSLEPQDWSNYIPQKAETHPMTLVIDFKPSQTGGILQEDRDPHDIYMPCTPASQLNTYLGPSITDPTMDFYDACNWIECRFQDGVFWKCP